MSSRTTWTLLLLAAGLGAFIFFFERHLQPPEKLVLPGRILPNLNTNTVSGIIVRPAQRIEISAIRKAEGWQLVSPIKYPASAVNVEGLLQTLSLMVWHAHISAQELKDRPNYGHEFGFDSPQFSLVIQSGNDQVQLLVGSLTPLKDEVFLQVVGRTEIYLVSSELLRFIPRTGNDWRNPALVELKSLNYNRLIVTNGNKTFQFRRSEGGKSWHISAHSLEVRADSPKLEHLLEQLETVRFNRFVTDDPKADLDSFGLETPELELGFALGDDPLLTLQFGKSPTNDATQIFARRADTTSIGLVAKEQLAAWRGAFDDFRDRHLVNLPEESVDELEFQGAENFLLKRQTNNTWRIAAPLDLPADTALVRETLGLLAQMQVVQFVKSVVTEPDLPSYGLSPVKQEYILRSRSSNTSATNDLAVRLQFGTVTNGYTYARRSDEGAICSVKTAELLNLPTAGWQLRERRLWNFNESEVSKLSIHQNGKSSELLHNGTNQWAFAAGSQGIVNNFAIEEVAGTLGELSAAYWTARNPTNLSSYGITDDSTRITVNVSRADKTEELTLQLGSSAPSQLQYGSTSVGGETWVFELPARTTELIRTYLAKPAGSF